MAWRGGRAFAHGVVGAINGWNAAWGSHASSKCRLSIAVEHLFDGLGVVEHAVVGGLRQRQHAAHCVGIDALQQGWRGFWRVWSLAQTHFAQSA